jgi:hypothetical protein
MAKMGSVPTASVPTASVPAAEPENIKISVREAERILVTLGSVNDGYDRTFEEKDGEKQGVKTVREHYPFTPKLRILIAKHMNELEKITRAWQTDRDAMLKRLSPNKDGMIDPRKDPALAREFFEQEQKERDVIKEYAAVKIGVDELHLDDYPSLNGNVLTVLMPIMVGF